MSAPSRIGESLLMRGYGLVMRVERCACGGFVGALEGDEPFAVEAHNSSELHQMWRVWADVLDELPSVDVYIVPQSLPLPYPTAKSEW